MSSQIDPKAYAEDCGCGAPAGSECPHTPIRCRHEFWYDNPVKFTEGPPRKIVSGQIRTCKLCGFQEVAEMTWRVTQSAYPHKPPRAA